jgi:thioredoxin-like negative regulator of GroEL
MSSLVAWIRVTEKRRLRVAEVDVDSNPALADVLKVDVVPTLVLLRGEKVLGRLEGRVTGNEIAELLGPHLGQDDEAGPSVAVGGRSGG